MSSTNCPTCGDVEKIDPSQPLPPGFVAVRIKVTVRRVIGTISRIGYGNVTKDELRVVDERDLAYLVSDNICEVVVPDDEPATQPNDEDLHDTPARD